MKMSIPVPARLKIGDPWYEERYSERLRELVFESGFSSSFVATLRFEHNKEDEMHLVKVCIAPNQKILSMYEQDRYPAVFNEKEMILGCDTACFEIATPQRYVNIGTLADGYFGDVHRFTYNRKCQGAIINLYICDDAFDERIQKEIEYVFMKEGT